MEAHNGFMVYFQLFIPKLSAGLITGRNSSRLLPFPRGAPGTQFPALSSELKKDPSLGCAHQTVEWSNKTECRVRGWKVEFRQYNWTASRQVDQ